MKTQVFCTGLLLLVAATTTQAQCSFTILDFPDSPYTRPNGISGDNVVGQYESAAGGTGFLYNGSSFTPFTLPGPGVTGVGSLNGISGNNIVGFYGNPATPYCLVKRFLRKAPNMSV